MMFTNNHKKILNAIGIFGSMHLVNMVVSILRTKFAALWLGSYGVGILGLYISIITLIMSIVNAGLPISIIRYLSEEHQKTSHKRLKIANTILIITGLLGTIFIFIFSSQIAILTFGDTSFTWAFRWIAISVFFKQLSSGYTSIFQSQKKIMLYANANLIANSLGIIITIPIYYHFRIEGIVYNLLIVAIIESFVFYLFLRRSKLAQYCIKWNILKKESQALLSQSLSFMLSGFFSLLSIFLVQIYVSRNSDYETLGIYIAGFSVLNTYVAVIFTAMGMEYFPRISKQKIGTENFSKEVNNQLFIGMKFLMPILLGLLLLAPWVINLLYNKEFLGSVHYIYLASLGVFFKLFSFVIGYVIISKGTEKLIIYNSIFFNFLFVLIHCLGFYFYQLKGIAIASTLYYLLHLIANYCIVSKKFSLKIKRKNLITYAMNALIILLSLGIFYFLDNDWIKYSIIIIFFIVSMINLIVYLNKIYQWKWLK